MIKKNILSVFFLVVLSALLLTGCGDNSTSEPKKAVEIKIGATAGPHAEVVEAVAKEAKKQGINIKVVEFSDYISPNKALSDGDLDLNSYQHDPFLQNFNKQNNTTLVPIGKTILMRMGIYSDKIKNIADIPNGATIAIPNDPTNGGRGLVLLEKAGLIKLKQGAGFKATVADVVENPKKLKFNEIEAAQLPRSIPDVAAAVITMNYVMSAGIDVEKQGLFLEPKDEPLAVMVLAARSKDKDNAVYKKIAEIYHSEGVKQFIKDKFKGTIVSAE